MRTTDREEVELDHSTAELHVPDLPAVHPVSADLHEVSHRHLGYKVVVFDLVEVREAPARERVSA